MLNGRFAIVRKINRSIRIWHNYNLLLVEDSTETMRGVAVKSTARNNNITFEYSPQKTLFFILLIW